MSCVSIAWITCVDANDRRFDARHSQARAVFVHTPFEIEGTTICQTSVSVVPEENPRGIRCPALPSSLPACTQQSVHSSVRSRLRIDQHGLEKENRISVWPSSPSPVCSHAESHISPRDRRRQQIRKRSCRRSRWHSRFCRSSPSPPAFE